VLTNQGFPPFLPCLLLSPLPPHYIPKLFFQEHFKSKWFCCLNPLVSVTLFFSLFFSRFLRIFQISSIFCCLKIEFFLSSLSIPPMAGCTQIFYRKKLSNSHYVPLNNNFYSYRVLFPLSRYIFNIDFQQAISKFINLYLTWSKDWCLLPSTGILK
jgi:hypothetical protein